MAERRGLALLGYFGANNFGDDLLLHYGVELAAAALPGEPVFASLMGGDTAGMAALGVTPVAGRDLTAWGRLLGRVRGLLLPGGGVFQDVTSLKSLGLYAALVQLAAWRGAKVGAYGQSLTPWRTALGAKVARRAFGLMDFVWWRDSLSQSQASAMQLPVRCLRLGADPALGLQPHSLQSQPPRFLGLNLRPWDGVLAHMGGLHAFAEEVAQQHGLPLKGVALMPEDERVLASLDLPEVIAYRPPMPPAAFLGSLVGMSAAVGMRYHFLLCASRLAAPFWVVSYDQKTLSVACEMGQPVLLNLMAPHPVMDKTPFSLGEMRKTLEENAAVLQKRHHDAQRELLAALKKWG